MANLNRPLGAPSMTFNDCVDFAIRTDDILFEGNKGKEDQSKPYARKTGHVETTITSQIT